MADFALHFACGAPARVARAARIGTRRASHGDLGRAVPGAARALGPRADRLVPARRLRAGLLRRAARAGGRLAHPRARVRSRPSADRARRARRPGPAGMLQAPMRGSNVRLIVALIVASTLGAALLYTTVLGGTVDVVQVRQLLAKQARDRRRAAQRHGRLARGRRGQRVGPAHPAGRQRRPTRRTRRPRA